MLNTLHCSRVKYSANTFFKRQILKAPFPISDILLGIINVSELYGVGAIREQKEIQLIVELEEWDSNKIYDRIGTNQRTMDLLGVKIPAIEIPVKPGRNLPIIIEAAAMNERLKKMGYNSAKDFNQNVLKWIETGEAQAAYYGQDDIY